MNEEDRRMRAIAFREFGEAPLLTDVPVPKPEAGEVLIRVRSSSVNGVDLAVIGGMFKDIMPHRFPVVVGKDFAGTVEAVGDGVTSLAQGDAVFGVVTRPSLGEGTFAEYVVIGEGFGIARVPDGLDHTQAGALGLAATAAVIAVDAVAPTAGECVLIAGATGGVGAYAIQLAAARGAHVIATARPGPETEFVRELGATSAVDYTADLAAQVRAISADGVPAALHLAGDGDLVAELVAPGGRLASTLGYEPDQATGRDRDIVATAVMASPDTGTLDWLATEAASGRLRIPISRTYSLAEAPQAFAEFRAGTIGKLAVVIAY
jgi:NADPH:quinone reductase-like Zn-dependent oxidoreductase